MRLASLLTRRNIVGILLVGVVVLGTGFGYVLPALSGADDGSVLPTKQSDQTGAIDAQSTDDSGDADITAPNSQTTRETGATPSQPTASSRSTSTPSESADEDTPDRADTSQGHTSTSGDSGHSGNSGDSDSPGPAGPDGSEDTSTSGLAVTGQTNAAAN